MYGFCTSVRTLRFPCVVAGCFLLIVSMGCNRTPDAGKAGIKSSAQNSAKETKTTAATTDAAKTIRSANRRARLYAYVLHINRVQSAVLENDMKRAERLLARCVPGNGEDDLRGFEWYYWKSRLHGELWSADSGVTGTRALDFSKDGKLLAVSDEQGRQQTRGRLRVFDVKSGQLAKSQEGKPLSDFPGFEQSECVAFSPDGALLASGQSYADGTIRLWDISTGKLAGTLKGHNDGTTDLAFLPGGKLLVSTGKDRVVRVTDWKTKKVQEAPPLKSSATRLAVSRDGKLVAVIQGRAFSVIDLVKKKLRFSISGRTYQDSPVRLQFSLDARTLLVAHRGASVTVHNIDNGKVEKTIKLPVKKEANIAAISPDANSVVTVSISAFVAQWSLKTGERLNEFPGRTFSSDPGAAVSPDGKYLVADADGRMRVWSLKPGNPEVVQGPAELGLGVAVSKDGDLVASASERVNFKYRPAGLWSRKTGKVIQKFDRQVISAAFSPDGKRLITWGSNKNRLSEVTIFDIPGKKVLESSAQKYGLMRGVVPTRLRFTPDGRLSFSSHGTHFVVDENQSIGRVMVRDGMTGKAKGNLDVDKYAVEDLVVSPDGKSLAVVDIKNRVQTWDLAAREKMKTYDLKTEIRQIAYLNDGRVLACINSDPQVILLNLTSDAPVPPISKSNAVMDEEFAISPDGKTAAYWSFRRDKLILLNVETGEPVTELAKFGEEERVGLLRFSTNGKSLLVFHSGNRIRIYHAGRQ